VISKTQKKFISRLCPHRGIGKENTLESIEAAISIHPFMVEFDVQLYRKSLHLGHPPDVNTESSLNAALKLFLKKSVMPKIDLKLNSRTYDEALAMLIDSLVAWNPRKALINIDGDLGADKFMEAESILVSRTSDSTRLNIDIGRYKNKSKLEINRHINNLARRPFSLSPNLDDNINNSINFALQNKIPQIHFWATRNRQYDLGWLSEIMDYVLSYGLEVRFDIRYENIMEFTRAHKSARLIAQFR
jgi:hypothetical protein